MKLVSLLALTCAAALHASDFEGIHTVYMMPMSHGLEQYIANALTTGHVFVIVTDPKKADAVLTDQIGSGLQERLNAMLTEPPPPPEKKDDKDAKEGDSSQHKSSLAEPENKLENPATFSSVGHSKGTVFLVETKSRRVVWSTYELPKDSTSRESDRIASAIVSRLRKDMGFKK